MAANELWWWRCSDKDPNDGLEIDLVKFFRTFPNGAYIPWPKQRPPITTWKVMCLLCRVW